MDIGLPLPAYARVGDAGLDLYSTADHQLAPGERTLISTGICVAIPEGYAGFVQPRSGLALTKGLGMVNSPGLIDSHYRGEIKIIAINLDPVDTIMITRGSRVAQLVVQRVEIVKLVEVPDLDTTFRGEAGFGSSGIF